MAERDWYPRHPLVWQADTLHLDPFAEGLYQRLVDWYYINRRPPPDNDDALAAICRVSLEAWQNFASKVRPYFVSRGGFLQHKRCNAELDKQDRKARALSESARNAANKRWSNNKALFAATSENAEESDASEIEGKSSIDHKGLDAAQGNLLDSCDTYANGEQTSIPINGLDAHRIANASLEREIERESKKEREDSRSKIRSLSERSRTPQRASGAARKSRAPAPVISTLPDDWQPAPAQITFATQLGIPERSLQREIVIYRGYWTSGKGAGVRRSSKGWDATYQRWMRKAADNFSERGDRQQQRRRPLV